MIKFLSKLPVFKQVYQLGAVDYSPYKDWKKIDERAEKKLNDLLSTVDMKSIVSLDKTHGIVYIGGERADEARLSNLKAEAEFFVQSELWHLIQETPKELAQRQMFVNSESLDDLRKGKSMLYLLSQQQNVINLFKGYQPKK